MSAAVLLCDNKKHQVQKIGWFMGVSFRPFYDCAIICRFVRYGFFFALIPCVVFIALLMKNFKKFAADTSL